MRPFPQTRSNARGQVGDEKLAPTARNRAQARRGPRCVLLWHKDACSRFPGQGYAFGRSNKTFSRSFMGPVCHRPSA